MEPTLTNQERTELAFKAFEGVSDEALKEMVRNGGVKKDREKLATQVKKIKEKIERLVPLLVLGKAYMVERVERHAKQQLRFRAELRQKITAADIYPAGFSMPKSIEEFKNLLAEPEVPEARPEVVLEPAPRRSRQSP
jgi:hypothetical protein